MSVDDFTTSSVQVNPSGGGGTVNEGVPIGSILMPSSHQKSTRFESVACADPSNTRTTNNPNMRAIATITTALAPPHRGRTGITPSPFNPYTTRRPGSEAWLSPRQTLRTPQPNHCPPPPPNGSASSISCQGHTHRPSSQLTNRRARPFATRRMNSRAALFLWENSS